MVARRRLAASTAPPGGLTGQIVYVFATITSSVK